MPRSSDPSRACGILSLLLTIPLAALPGAAHATCPSNRILCNGQDIVTNHPLGDLTCPVAGGYSSIDYDLLTGSILMGANGGAQPSSVTVFVSDDYRLLGLPPGTPVSFTAELLVSGSLSSTGCGSTAGLHAKLREVGSDPDSIAALLACDAQCVCTGPTSVDTVLHVQITHAAGDVFTLAIEVGADALRAGVSLFAQVTFSGLPQGTFIESCQGYHLDAPVPIRPASWGTLKQRYR